MMPLSPISSHLGVSVISSWMKNNPVLANQASDNQTLEKQWMEHALLGPLNKALADVKVIRESQISKLFSPLLQGLKAHSSLNIQTDLTRLRTDVGLALGEDRNDVTGFWQDNEPTGHEKASNDKAQGPKGEPWNESANKDNLGLKDNPYGNNKRQVSENDVSRSKSSSDLAGTLNKQKRYLHVSQIQSEHQDFVKHHTVPAMKERITRLAPKSLVYDEEYDEDNARKHARDNVGNNGTETSFSKKGGNDRGRYFAPLSVKEPLIKELPIKELSSKGLSAKRHWPNVTDSINESRPNDPVLGQQDLTTPVKFAHPKRAVALRQDPLQASSLSASPVPAFNQQRSQSQASQVSTFKQQSAQLQDAECRVSGLKAIVRSV